MDKSRGSNTSKTKKKSRRVDSESEEELNRQIQKQKSQVRMNNFTDFGATDEEPPRVKSSRAPL